VNAGGTLNLLEAVRRHALESVFVHLSTNKVYDDRPNPIRLKELPTRWEYDDGAFANIGEGLGLRVRQPVRQGRRRY